MTYNHDKAKVTRPEAGKLPSLSYLLECFIYDPASGEVTWRERPAYHFVDERAAKLINGKFSGKKISGANKDGYRQVGLNGKRYKLHRLIWKMHYREDPLHHIDHINRNTGDNRIDNLRLATPLDNTQNCGKRRDNSSGATGVCWHKATGKWYAFIRINTKQKYLGVFANKGEAILARKNAEKMYERGEFYKFKAGVI